MAIVTLRPNASSAADYTSTPAGTAAHVILARNVAAGTATTAQFIQRTDGRNTKSAIIDFGTTTVSATQQVRRVRLRVNAQTPDKNSNMAFAIGFSPSAGVSRWGPELLFAGRKASQVYEGPWAPVAPGGGLWTQRQIDEVQVRITDAATKANRRGRTHLLFVDVDIATQGTTSVSQPSGSVANTSRPTVRWSFSQPEGEGQAFFQVRVYTLAQTLETGFTPLDPAQFRPVWDSGERRSTSTAQRVGVSLENGDYVAYVRAGISIANNPYWSEWATSQFEIALVLPDTPTVTASHSPTFGRVTVGAGLTTLGTAYSSRTVQFQRLDGDWVDIASTAAEPTAGTAFFVDYLAPRGGTVFYRARQVAILSDETIPSAFGTASVVVPNDGTWWFKPLNSLGNSLGGVKVEAGFSTEFSEQAAVYEPIGRASNVVISAGLTGRSGQFRITTVGEAEWQALEKVLEEVGPVFVEAPTGENLTVRFASRQWQTGGMSANAVRQVTVNWVGI